MARRSWTAIVVTLLCAAAGQAQAEAAQTRIVFAPRRALEAGEVVTVGWEGLPASVEELEFLLVTDDGEKIRLTPELMPSRTSFRWKVPNLPSRAAVLELRAGIDGEELVLAASDSFAIHGGVARKAHVEFRDGEWWSVETGEHVPVPPFVVAVRRTAVSQILVRPRQWLPRAATDLGDARQSDAHETTQARVDTRRGAPLVVPQRK